MPIYRYRCDHCGHEFKVMTPFSQGDAVQVCGQCGANAAHRQLARVATIYKGSGFYTTSNYRKNGSKSTSSGSKESTTSAASEDG